MPELKDPLIALQSPTPDRPLLGTAVLVVEDSRYASDALRLMCLRSGARIRRADSLRSARRHMAAFSPSVVIVDLGLPDGPGTDLIGEIAERPPPRPALFGISGDPDGKGRAMGAGADGFLDKPVPSLATFQARLLAALNRGGIAALRPVTAGEVEVDPDPLALVDDLVHLADILTASNDLDRATIGYAVQFLRGLAGMADDAELTAVAAEFADHYSQGQPIRSDIARIAALVQNRLAARDAL